ncbi:MAG: WD40-repeat-containing domain protein [Benniella sp.]|nr:MAG: WD40-repeat-containing domain protein [Benniella sp.]
MSSVKVSVTLVGLSLVQQTATWHDLCSKDKLVNDKYGPMDTMFYTGSYFSATGTPWKPLVWRTNLPFLEERVKQEPVFKQQLPAYIEYSQKDKKWRKVAANAITNGHEGHAQCVAFPIQGDVVTSASNDSTVNLWNVATGEHRATLCGHSDAVIGVVFSPDDAETGMCNYILVGHTEWVRDIVYSPHGDQLASASYDNTIRLWDPEAGSECRLTLTGHSDMAIGIAYSPQGDLLATSSWDKTDDPVSVTTMKRPIKNDPGPRAMIMPVPEGSRHWTVRLLPV